jgi:hypothetical protein
MAKVVFACPVCDVPSQASLDAPNDWQCPACDHRLRLDATPPTLTKCAVCGNHELYKRKDFPHGLGMVLLVVACTLSLVTYGLYQKFWTWFILLGTALFDGILFAMVGDAIVCYRCNAHHKGFSSEGIEPFELTIGERYRQERLRKEQFRK